MKIKYQDSVLFSRLFESSPGYILNFSNKTFTIFFDEELNIDIDDAVYLAEDESNSKAKRLWRLITKSDRETVLRVTDRLWSYKKQTDPEDAERLSADYHQLIERLNSVSELDQSGGKPVPAYTGVSYAGLTDEMNSIKSLPPHQRGYRFETWLKQLFAAFRLEPRAGFRNTGEQIDGSFKMEGEYYLLEAKWHKGATPAPDLHVFDGKLRQKASWTRGVFISWNGFTPDCFEAFGRGSSVVCVSGADIYHSLGDRIPFPVLLDAKIRQASESGKPYVPYKELPEFRSN